MTRAAHSHSWITTSDAATAWSALQIWTRCSPESQQAHFGPWAGTIRKLPKPRAGKTIRNAAASSDCARRSKQQRDWTTQFREIAQMPADDPGQMAEIRQKYLQLRRRDSAWGAAKFACDLWSTAFYVRLSSATEHAITTTTVRNVLAGLQADLGLSNKIEATAERYRFFHWAP